MIKPEKQQPEKQEPEKQQLEKQRTRQPKVPPKTIKKCQKVLARKLGYSSSESESEPEPESAYEERKRVQKANRKDAERHHVKPVKNEKKEKTASHSPVKK